jgi:hypothetical protein
MDRGIRQLGRTLRKAARQAARAPASGPRNVAAAVNVGGRGKVRGVSVVQTSRRRPDGTEVVETTRTTYGDADAEG